MGGEPRPLLGDPAADGAHRQGPEGLDDRAVEGAAGQRVLGGGPVLLGGDGAGHQHPRLAGAAHRLAPDPADHEGGEHDQHGEQHHGRGGGERGGAQGLLLEL